MADEILWKPQPKQIAFMARPEYEVLYGGAAGGGKSDALLMEALRQIHIPTYRGIIFRKTYPQLEALIDRSRVLYKAAGGAYHQQDKRWRFPSGASIFFGYMNHDSDRYNYQGKPYSFVGFDELTQFTWTQYSYLFSRNRPNGPGERVYMRATANPGGIGHGWVKERFISPAPPLTTMRETVQVRHPDGSVHDMSRDRVYVPATVFDNQALMEADPNYVATLALLPEAERQSLLYGSWDSFEGQVFTEWRNDPEHYGDQKWTHVVEPFDIPRHWKIYRGFDFGYAKPFSVGWYAVDERKGPRQPSKIYRIREYYGCTGTPNQGIKLNPYEIAEEIRRIESEDPVLRDKHITGIADPSIYDESRGESIARMMEKHPNYIQWAPGDNNRLAGKMQYHYRLAFDEDGEPLFQVFSTCHHFIRTITTLVYDEKHVEDINTEQEDHIYDECRYVLQANPVTPRAHHPAPDRLLDDPLDLRPKKQVKFYRI